LRLAAGSAAAYGAGSPFRTDTPRHPRQAEKAASAQTDAERQRQHRERVRLTDELFALADASRDKEDYIEGAGDLDLAVYVEAVEGTRAHRGNTAVHARGHFSLAVLFEENGDVEAAMRHYTKALEIDPRDADSHDFLAHLLEKKGDVDAAIHHYTKTLEIDPHDAESHFFLACLLKDTGDVEAAMRHYTKALEIDPRGPFH
jgi:predicted TPR repeat methyltransferase